eukprot:COSAG06_NODE_56925_length_282_cov_1.125683_1_plen_30_part_01
MEDGDDRSPLISESCVTNTQAQSVDRISLC